MKDAADLVKVIDEADLEKVYTVLRYQLINNYWIDILSTTYYLIPIVYRGSVKQWIGSLWCYIKSRYMVNIATGHTVDWLRFIKVGWVWYYGAFVLPR